MEASNFHLGKAIDVHTKHQGTSSRMMEGNLTQAKEVGSLEHFFDFTPANGVITNRLSKTRVFMLSSEMWNDVEKELIRIFSTAGLVILENIGHSYGVSFAKRTKSRSSSPTIGSFQNLASASGWGKFSVTSDEESGSWIRVISNDCSFCHARDQSSHRECMFLSGLIRGMAEEFYAKSYVVLRNKCSNFEMHSCEIALQQS